VDELVDEALPAALRAPVDDRQDPDEDERNGEGERAARAFREPRGEVGVRDAEQRGDYEGKARQVSAC